MRFLWILLAAGRPGRWCARQQLGAAVPTAAGSAAEWRCGGVRRLGRPGAGGVGAVPAARVYRVTRDGTVTEMITFGDIVPTGLAVRGATIYLAEAGPVPHLPGTGTVVSFGPK